MKLRPSSLGIAAGLLLTACLTNTASANNLNVFAGSNIGSDEAGLAVAEYVIPVLFEVGPFFEWSRNTGTPDNRYTLGGVLRMPTPWLNFVTDVRLGYNWNTSPNRVGDRNGFSFEPGIGYRLFGKVVDIIPRIGFNAVTSNDDLPVVNLSVGVAFVL